MAEIQLTSSRVVIQCNLFLIFLISLLHCHSLIPPFGVVCASPSPKNSALPFFGILKKRPPIPGHTVSSDVYRSFCDDFGSMAGRPTPVGNHWDPQREDLATTFFPRRNIFDSKKSLYRKVEKKKTGILVLPFTGLNFLCCFRTCCKLGIQLCHRQTLALLPTLQNTRTWWQRHITAPRFWC